MDIFWVWRTSNVWTIILEQMAFIHESLCALWLAFDGLAILGWISNFFAPIF